MKLFFRQTGTTGHSANQPLIILHGLFGSSDNWLTHSKFFAGQGFRVFAIDQRNHGQSPHHNDMDYDSLAADLYEFLLDHALTNVVLLGHSMGGKTVMQYAMNYPSDTSAVKIDKLIVVDIAPRAYPVHHAEIIRGLNALDLSRFRSRQEADAAFAEFEPIPAVRQFLLKNLYRPTGETGFAWRLNVPVITREIETVGENLRNVHPIDLPTLFVRGAESDYITDDDLPEISRLFPQSQVETIADAGHWVQAQQPVAFGEAVMGFLSTTTHS
jgi:esterase